MFDDLATYYHDNVLTEFVDYQDAAMDTKAGRSRDLRLALVAAAALFHLREHLATPGAPSRSDVEQRCPDYGLLGDVVNAAKHKTISQQTPHGAPLVNQATNIEERKLLIEYADAIGTYRHSAKTVVVTQADGVERNLLEVMTNVINHWETHLHALGVIPSARAFTFKDPARHRTREECNGGQLDLEVVQGQRLVQSVQLLRFNSATGKAEPVDLTGATIRGSIYKPEYEFGVSLSHDATGTEYKTTVTLNEAECAALAALSTDEEREAFAMSTQLAKAALLGLAQAAGLTPRNGED